MDNQTAQQTQQPIEIPAEVRGFLESLLADSGMTSLDDQMREDMLQELYLRLDNFLTAQIVDNLPPEQLEPFIQMNEAQKPKAEIEQFLKDNMPNAQEVFANAFIEFRNLYLGNTAVAQNAPSDQQDTGGTN